MDYICRKLNNMVNISNSGTIDKQTYLRERIEYILFLILGFLWNRNFHELPIEKRNELILSLKNISIGSVVSQIRILDINKEILGRKTNSIDNYPNLRNRKFGHGFSHEDIAADIEEDLENLFEDLLKEIEWLNKDFDIIKIKGINGENYSGIRIDNNTMLNQWLCNKRAFLTADEDYQATFIYDGDNYYRISPFIDIEKNGDEVYIFCSLKEKLSGKVSQCRLFYSGEREKNYPELIVLNELNIRRRCSVNGTIMNYFNNNFVEYINTPIEKPIKDFLEKNKSNVSATVWGHGGVGKTASIQNVCNNYYNDFNNKFEYIVFLSAKDRMYDPINGKIREIEGLRTYEDVLGNIVATLFDEEPVIIDGNEFEMENKIAEFRSKTLFIIDDYETFIDRDKERIQLFIKKLDINFHKVIITTRNKQLSSGYDIPTNEFNKDLTLQFIESVINNEYPEMNKQVIKEIRKQEVLQKIFDATSGRAIFIYQLVHLIAQQGYTETLLSKLQASDNAKEFLYGRIYSYLSDNGKNAFMCISQIINEKDLIFRGSVLLFLLESDDEEIISQSLGELIDQKVIENYVEDYYRVYSRELLILMKKNYEKSSQRFQDNIYRKLSSLGGKDIKGTVYDAMLAEANRSQTYDTEEAVVSKYVDIIKSKKCDLRNKKEALISIITYLIANPLNVEKAIKITKEYLYLFKNDADIIKMYVQLLWRGEKVSKREACKVLVEFFENNDKKETKNLELFSIATLYCTYNVIKDYETQLSKNENILKQVFSNYGKMLFEKLDIIKYENVDYSIKNTVLQALVMTLELTVTLSRKDSNMLYYSKKLWFFLDGKVKGELWEQHRKLDKRIKELFSPKVNETKRFYNVEDSILGKVFRIYKNRIVVALDNSYKATVYIDKISNKYIENINDVVKLGQEIKAKVIKIDDYNEIYLDMRLEI